MINSKFFKILCHYNKLLLLLATISVLLVSCTVSNQAPTTQKTVTSNNLSGDSLHNTGVCTSSACEGETCQTAGCHSSGDTQNGAFTVSGTVFQPDLVTAYSNSNAVIEFYSSPNGGAANLIDTLPVDKYGNFYTTAEIVPAGSGMYPAFYDVDTNRRVFMPRPIVPIRPTACNNCHGLSDQAKAGTELQFPDLSTNPNPGPPYLRISNGVTSSQSADTSYHSTFTIDPGPDCMKTGCHSDTGTVFSVAGSVIETGSTAAYTFVDAAIEFFSQPCLDPPTCATSRTLVPKMLLELDGKGNFYTTLPIDWSSNTYPTLANYDANTVCRNLEHMVSAITSTNAGDCYSCHDGVVPNPPPISIYEAQDASESCN